MSRAFVREPDAPEPTCPTPAGCGGRGVSVEAITLKSNVDEETAKRLAFPVFFCDDPACTVAYFDAAGGRIEVKELLAKRWPKDQDAPLCPCFSVSEDDVVDWARDGNTAAMRAFLEKAEGSGARCLTQTHDGQSCVREARRVFMAERGAG